MALAYALVTTAVTLSQVVGGPLAGGILYLDGKAGLSGWQWLFILEGAITVAWALLIKVWQEHCNWGELHHQYSFEGLKDMMPLQVFLLSHSGGYTHIAIAIASSKENHAIGVLYINKDMACPSSPYAVSTPFGW